MKYHIFESNKSKFWHFSFFQNYIVLISWICKKYRNQKTTLLKILKFLNYQNFNFLYQKWNNHEFPHIFIHFFKFLFLSDITFFNFIDVFQSLGKNKKHAINKKHLEDVWLPQSVLTADREMGMCSCNVVHAYLTRVMSGMDACCDELDYIIDDNYNDRWRHP